MKRIRDRDREAILQSLRAGVVPGRGLDLIMVGRANELAALIRDIDRIADSGTAIRFIIGAYGSGKTFFLNLVRSVALERKLVVVSADLSPDRRLFSTRGQARALYAELMRNMSTRSVDTGALSGVVERFVATAVKDAREMGAQPEIVIQENLNSLAEMAGGYDFAHVVECYWRGHHLGEAQLMTDAIRWLRAEFSTRTDARKALGVRTIIDDDTFYQNIKLTARLVQLAGYRGLLVSLDELVNLYKLSNTKARNTNFEQILKILNDCLQGSVQGLGFLFGGTPEFLTDTRRGLYSYGALQSRLTENTFAKDLQDFDGPTIRLTNLAQEDVYVLLSKLRHVQARGDVEKYLISDMGLESFMNHCLQKVGESYFRTPRNTIREFLNLLSVLEQNPEVGWADLIIPLEKDDAFPEDAEDETENEDVLTSFIL